VRSAVKLDAGDFAAIVGILEKTWRKKVESTEEVDPGLLGGFVVRVGHAMVDLSLRTKLEALAQRAAQ
jgi:F-type H+-transporting ATPase subunit delta